MHESIVNVVSDVCPTAGCDAGPIAGNKLAERWTRAAAIDSRPRRGAVRPHRPAEMPAMSRSGEDMALEFERFRVLPRQRR
jgi:hypothetical protein